MTTESKQPSQTPTVVTKKTSKNVEYTLYSDNTATITKYTGSDTDLTLVSTITHNNGNYSVTKIADGVFSGKTSLRSVALPRKLDKIGKSAFKGDKNLIAVLNGDTVTEIGDEAFSGCTSLTNNPYLYNVVKIGDRAFYNCSSLLSMYFGYNSGDGSPNIIGTEAFAGCTRLQNITFSGKYTIGKSAFKNCNMLSTVLMFYPVTCTSGDKPFQHSGKVHTNIYTADQSTYDYWAKRTGTSASCFLQRWFRFSGKDRYTTASSFIGACSYPSESDNIIVASGANFPDALTASSLAGVKNGYVLLTDPNSLSDLTAKQIQRLSSGKATVYIIGGEGAVSKNVETQISKLWGVSTVKRISGTDRVDTSMKIYENGKGSWGNTCFVATADNFADSLSISPCAYANKYPIFAAHNGNLTSEQLDVIKSSGIKKVVVIGGKASVSDSTYGELQNIFGESNTMRLSGANRYDTSGAIFEWETGGNSEASFQPGKYLYKSNMIVATGKNFPDSLAAGSVCGAARSPLLIVDGSKSTQTNIDTLIKNSSTKPDTGCIVGGTKAVPKSLEDKLNEADP
ncbi:MAG: cell wall-binding repeat-containing protein, partial [Coriobacteriales bacterium]